MTKKIAIVCGSPSSEMLAPFEDESWEIWVLGNRMNRFAGKRVTRIFEIHDDLKEHGDIVAYVTYLVNLKIPMVVGRGFPLYLSESFAKAIVEEFPFAAAVHLFGSKYLTSSSAYMMALALIEGATEIGIFGVDMAIDDHEYFWQRPCMEAWIGFAKGRGVKVTIPEISPIGKCDYVEGENSGGKPEFKQFPFTEEEFLRMASEHENKMLEIEQQVSELNCKYQIHDGAKQTYQRLAQVARATEAGIKINSLSQTNLII